MAHLAARHNIHIQYGIIGCSEMDKAGKVKAGIMTWIMIKAMYEELLGVHPKEWCALVEKICLG